TDPALGGVQPQLHRVEVEHAVALDHDLAVERRVRWQQLADFPQLWEIAKKRPRVAAPEIELARQVFENPAEAIPLRLVLPIAHGQLGHEFGLHRRKWKFAWRHQAGCNVSSVRRRRRAWPAGAGRTIVGSDAKKKGARGGNMVSPALKPSHFGSYCQSPVGSSVTSSASIGGQGRVRGGAAPGD